MAEALKLLEREALDALVCDRHLGDGSVEQIRQFLETSGRSEVPVIVLSGDSSLAELRAKGLPALEKPVDPESLLREIERTLGRHPVAIGG
jgi:DNA-binding response OmpR family regulator